MRFFATLLATLLALPAGAALADTLPTPTFPMQPQSRAECDAVSRQYSEIQREINHRHEECLKSQSCKNSQKGFRGLCTCAACENLHSAMNRYSNGDIAAFRRASEQRCHQVAQANQDSARLMRQQQLAAQQQFAAQQQAAIQQQMRDEAERQRRLALQSQQQARDEEERRRQQQAAIQQQTRDEAERQRQFALQSQQQQARDEEERRRLQMQILGEQQRREQEERSRQFAPDEQRRQLRREQEERNRQFALDEQRRQQRRDQEERQRDLALIEQNQRRLDEAVELQKQLALIEQRYRAPEPQASAAPPAPPPPASPPASGIQRLKESVARAGDRWDALMRSNVRVGDTDVNVGGLKDTLVSLTATVLSEINPSTLFRAFARGAGQVATNPVLELAGPFLDPENARNIRDAVEGARRQARDGTMNVNTARQLREVMAEMERMDRGL